MPRLTDVPRKRSFLGKLWALTAPYFVSSGSADRARRCWSSIIAIVLAMVYVNYLLNGFYGDFNNMLQKKDLTPTPVAFFGHTLHDGELLRLSDRQVHPDRLSRGRALGLQHLSAADAVRCAGGAG